MIYLDLSCIWIGRAWGPGAQAQSVLMLIVMRETYMKRPLSEWVETAKRNFEFGMLNFESVAG